jgi:hypothetical protein
LHLTTNPKSKERTEERGKPCKIERRNKGWERIQEKERKARKTHQKHVSTPEYCPY